ncbi:MAG: hypothetical protein ABT01_05320 [Clostridium sp. SCN 57-10]|nr:MAG: hypothetical protein ABT01_05320 [Clostridium sp. SCN 57-10]
MKISLKDVSTAPGRQICFDYTIDLSREEVNFELPFPEPVRIVGAVRDVAGVLHLEARAEADVHRACARCGQPIVYEQDAEISFVLVKKLEGEMRDDMLVVESDELELDEVAVPELILSMDMAELCSEDCKGICPQCGRNLNEGDCGCRQDKGDPRWDVLRRAMEK